MPGRLGVHCSTKRNTCCSRCRDSNSEVRGQILLWGLQGGHPVDLPFPLTLLNDFMVFSSVNDLVIHCWAPLSWSSPLISTKLISSLPRFLLPCSRLNWKRGGGNSGVGGLGRGSGDVIKDPVYGMIWGLPNSTAPLILSVHYVLSPCHLPSGLMPGEGLLLRSSPGLREKKAKMYSQT